MDRLGATLAPDLASWESKRKPRKVFEAPKATKEEKNEETPPSDDDDESDEEETTMFERVFGDACKKVPKSNDKRQLDAAAEVEEALDAVDTLEREEKKTEK